MSFNIRALLDDGEAVSRVIRAAAPDVVCIQEAPRFLRWRSRCAALARRSGMVVVGGGRLAGSNLILSTLGVDVEQTHDILFTRDPKLHLRGTALAILRVRGARVAVAGTHLDLEEGPRLRHVGELHATLDRLVPAGVPAVVAGDMNALPDSAVWAALARRGTDAFAAAGEGDGFTYSAVSPVRRIDGIFADAPIEVRSAVVLDGADVRVASDHRPLLVELELP